VKSKEQAPAFIKDMKDKVRIVFYGDAPTCATGFATVSRNILTALHETGRYDIKILGINYWGDPHPFPFPIWPTGTNQQKDPYGRQKVANMIPQMEFDVLFFLQDSFILNFLPQLVQHLKAEGRKFKSVCYFPIDGVPKKEWIDSVSVVDVPVTYTQFGYDECLKKDPDLKKKLKIVPHGVNPKDFNPIEESFILPFRSQYFGPQSKKYIYMNLNRNQQRKDIPRSLLAYKTVHEQDPETLLYLHMAVRDQGWNLDDVVKGMGLDMTSDVLFPQNFGPNMGFPIKTLNAIYNSVDCVMSTALGEGWGLSWIEAMATKTPVIMPNNTAITENISEDMGYLVDSGTNPSLFTVLPWDNEVVRPTVDTAHLVELMNHVKENKKEAREKAEIAYKHVMNNFIWERHIVPIWIDLIDNLVAEGFSDEPKIEKQDLSQNTILTESF
jgi:glycosyltransferase involved in cell wall biosynthesis